MQLATAQGNPWWVLDTACLSRRTWVEKNGFWTHWLGHQHPIFREENKVSHQTDTHCRWLPLHTWAITKARSHSLLCQSHLVHRSFLLAACFHPHNSRVLHTSAVELHGACVISWETISQTSTWMITRANRRIGVHMYIILYIQPLTWSKLV